jgi:hypothetical protein
MFLKNCNLLIPRTSKLQEKSSSIFIPQKRTFRTSKLEFSSLSWVIFALLVPVPYSQCESGFADSDPKEIITDPEHLFQMVILHIIYYMPHEGYRHSLL